jgi:hypothetical protein
LHTEAIGVGLLELFKGTRTDEVKELLGGSDIGERGGLTTNVTLVASEEEGAIFPKRATEGPAELVELETWF